MYEINGSAEDILREIFLAFVRMHVLYHASQEPIYGAEMIAELARHGYSIGPGTLYPVLHSLQECGFLEDERRVVGGKVRRYYRLTPSGNEALELLRKKVRELVDEVLYDRSPVSGESAVTVLEGTAGSVEEDGRLACRDNIEAFEHPTGNEYK